MSYLVKVTDEVLTIEELEAATDLAFDQTVNALTVDVDGLEANTEYYVYIQSNCENGEWEFAEYFVTPCDPITVDAENPYTETFENVEDEDIPVCWDALERYSPYPCAIEDEYSSYEGDKYMEMYTSSYYSAPENIMALTPMNDINTLIISFYAKTYSSYYAPNVFEIGYIKNDEFNSLKTFTLTTNYQRYSTLLSDAPADAERIAFRSYRSSGTSYAFVDNISVRIPSSEAEITDFTFPTRMSTPEIDSEYARVNAIASYQADLANLEEEVTTSLNATFVETNSEEDGNVKTFNYTVTAEDEVTTKDWTVTVTKADAPSSENDIVSFSFAGQSGELIIDPESKTVTAHAEYNFDLVNTDIAPEIGVSPMATIDPASGTARNFSEPVEYVVTAEDLTPQTWTVTITIDPEDCPNPDAIVATNITNNAATLSWNQMYLESSYLVKVSTTEFSSDEELEAATDLVFDQTVDALTTDLADLAANTEYFVYIQSVCNITEGWAEYSFRTECDVFSLPFTESFNNYS
jgi:hypothetical protein